MKVNNTRQKFLPILGLCLLFLLSSCGKSIDESAKDSVSNCDVQLIKQARKPTTLSYQRLVYFGGDGKSSSFLFGIFLCQDNYEVTRWHRFKLMDSSSNQLVLDIADSEVIEEVDDLLARVKDDVTLYDNYYLNLDEKSINTDLSAKAEKYEREGKI